MAGLLLGCARGRAQARERQRAGARGPDQQGRAAVATGRRRACRRAQVSYAAIDAAVAYRAGQAMHGMMDERLRRCFRLQNRAVPVVAKMRLAGVPFDRAVHLETIAALGARARRGARALRRADRRGAAGPAQGRRLDRGASAGRGDRLDAAHAGRRTERAQRSAEVPRAPRGDPAAAARALGAQAAGELRPQLIELIDPSTGRIYPDYLTCGAKTGRLTSSQPERASSSRADGRAAITAPAGRLLVVGDLDQIELRVFAELADEQVMREVFAAGGDIHRRTAAAISGVPESEIGKRTRAGRPPRRSTSASCSPPARGRSAPRHGRSSTST